MRGATMKDAMVYRMISVVTRRFGAVGGVAECRGKVRLNVRRRVWRDEHALLPRMTSDAERLAKSSVARAVELHEADGTRIDEVPYRKAVPFAVGMPQEDVGCLCLPAFVRRVD